MWAPSKADAAGADTRCYDGANMIAGEEDVPDAQGIEALDPQKGYAQKVIYSRDGSFHRNKYGYLVDINGLLLVANGHSMSTDPEAKWHIHIPSRHGEVYFDGNGKVWVTEANGATYTNVGQIQLIRFENPQGLNIFRRIQAHCVAYDNEFGFMLGSWCADTWIDGHIVEYRSETTTSGVGIVGYPMEQGFGRLEKGPPHKIASYLRGMFSKIPGWSTEIDGRGYFQFRYIIKIIDPQAWSTDGSSVVTVGNVYGSAYHAAHAAGTGYYN